MLPLIDGLASSPLLADLARASVREFQYTLNAYVSIGECED